jgi:hypothetical protein
MQDELELYSSFVSLYRVCNFVSSWSTEIACYSFVSVAQEFRFFIILSITNFELTHDVGTDFDFIFH